MYESALYLPTYLAQMSAYMHTVTLSLEALCTRGAVDRPVYQTSSPSKLSPGPTGSAKHSSQLGFAGRGVGRLCWYCTMIEHEKATIPQNPNARMRTSTCNARVCAYVHA